MRDHTSAVRTAEREAGGPRPLGLVACRDGALRRAAATALAEAGYNVLEASDGRSATHLCIDHGERLGVAVIEVELCMFGEHPLAAFVGRYFPALPIVHLAPAGDDDAPASAPAQGYGPTLRPPLTVAEFVERIEAAARSRVAPAGVESSA